MPKQDVSVLWTEALSMQVVHVNSTRCVSLVKVNLGYAFAVTITQGYGPVRTPTILSDSSSDEILSLTSRS